MENNKNINPVKIQFSWVNYDGIECHNKHTIFPFPFNFNSELKYMDGDKEEIFKFVKSKELLNYTIKFLPCLNKFLTELSYSFTDLKNDIIINKESISELETGVIETYMDLLIFINKNHSYIEKVEIAV